jgi:hypothetical protein
MTSGCAIFSATARCLRKIRRPSQFNRHRASVALRRKTEAYWRGGASALFDYLDAGDRWSEIQRHCRRSIALSKAMSDDDREFLVRLLAELGYYEDVEAAAAVIVEATQFATFESAAKFAMAQLGVAAPQFTLKNERLRDFIMSRADAAVHATRNNLDGILDTIVRNFYELGSNPYDATFIKELQSAIGKATAWEARRFALTETGIVAERAQIETYRRNGVTRKRWNIRGVNTRPSHQALSGVEIDIDEKFDVGGYPADHPLDPTLPPGELINCRCSHSPVVSDDFQIDPDRVWEGQ